jgi:uncharacterized iron-regulated protein
MHRCQHNPTATTRAQLRTLLGVLGAAAIVSACAVPAAGGNGDIDRFVTALLPVDAILLGEQHDAPDHHRIERETVQALAARGALAALAVEMADAGTITTGLPADASEEQVRAALQWNERAWPWQAYGPSIMTAVRAGVRVAGANLPRAQVRIAMEDTQYDMQLSGPALKAQQQLIRLGHCNMLPESQITPMTRIQIARDQSMANTLSHLRSPGKTVLLLAGSGHVDRKLGVPQHLPEDLKIKAIGLQAHPAPNTTETITSFDQLWPAQPAPEKDHCTEFRNRMDAKPASTTP